MSEPWIMRGGTGKLKIVVEPRPEENDWGWIVYYDTDYGACIGSGTAATKPKALQEARLVAHTEKIKNEKKEKRNKYIKSHRYEEYV